jgi:GDP/UDP-N,N'-diacetylbacillosamine 2-epimerase (hydrolysing)
MGSHHLIKVLVLTSSRADFGIYLPLLKAIEKNKGFELKILAFGSHVSKFHGYTINQIKEEGFKVDYQISTLLTNDEAVDVSTAFSLTALKFSDFWNNNNQFDWVLVLGDRFEMAAAVSAGIPYNIPFVHFYGGDTTLGAIDNIYRNIISVSSKLHFVALEQHQEKLSGLIEDIQKKCLVIGSLSIENIKNIKLLSKEEFYKKWRVDLSNETILITIHPETVNTKNNIQYVKEIYEALLKLAKTKQLIITMPNADTNGIIFREMYQKLKSKFDEQVFLIENFGTQSYFSCMKYVGLMIGNTSSGKTEAASFKKYVLNIGDRQKGRLSNNNVITLPFKKELIIEKSNQYFGKEYSEKNIYDKSGSINKIINKLKISK